MRYRTDDNLESLVERLLKELGLWNVRWLDLMTVIIGLKQRFRGFKGYERVPDHLLPDAEAQWDSERGVLRMRESTFRAMQNNDPHARNTIAEEIGHFALGHSGIRNRSMKKTAAEKVVPKIMHEEAEAKRFAPRLLAPAKLIPTVSNPEEIVKQFGLSRQSSLIRKEEVDRMTRHAEGKERPLPSFVVDFLREAKKRGVKIRTDLD